MYRLRNCVPPSMYECMHKELNVATGLCCGQK